MSHNGGRSARFVTGQRSGSCVGREHGRPARLPAPATPSSQRLPSQPRRAVPNPGSPAAPGSPLRTRPVTTCIRSWQPSGVPRAPLAPWVTPRPPRGRDPSWARRLRRRAQGLGRMWGPLEGVEVIFSCRPHSRVAAPAVSRLPPGPGSRPRVSRRQNAFSVQKGALQGTKLHRETKKAPREAARGGGAGKMRPIGAIRKRRPRTRRPARSDPHEATGKRGGPHEATGKGRPATGDRNRRPARSDPKRSDPHEGDPQGATGKRGGPEGAAEPGRAGAPAAYAARAPGNGPADTMLRCCVGRVRAT